MTNNSLPDYSQDQQWLIKPETIRYPVDVFYLCPTAYYDGGLTDPLCGMDDQGVRTRMLEHIENKGSAFITVGNFFAPMYRQANVDCLVSTDPEASISLMEGPVASTQQAFKYYMEHLNGGRPFILAGHSQGSIMLSIILGSIFKKKPEYNRKLVAAYIIGYGITPFYLAENPHLKFAKGRDDTGVIISYNTESPGVTAHNITLPNDSICINPITWTRGPEPASPYESLGSHLIVRDSAGNLVSRRDVRHFADCRLSIWNGGVVVCSTANPDDFRSRRRRKALPPGHPPHRRLPAVLLRPAPERRGPHRRLICAATDEYSFVTAGPTVNLQPFFAIPLRIFPFQLAVSRDIMIYIA